MAELSPDLKAGLVRILQADGETTSGSGFILSEGGLIATCSHVIQPEKLQVRGYPRPERVALIFRANGQKGVARLLLEAWRSADSEDVALLQLEGPLPSGVEPLPLGSSEGSSGHAFQTFGFPDFSPIEGVYGDGHILNETTVQGMKVLQVSSPQVTPGFSGAPVLDTEARRVVGMVTSIAAPDKFGRLMETAFVTPTETLISIYPQLILSDVRPYLGLAAFTEKDAEFFFGRRRLVESLVDALRSRPRFLLVMGPSGSGKSSVVQAGLMPRLREGGVPGSDRWGILVVRPADHPFDQLESKGLEGASKGLVDAVSIYLKRQAGTERMLLVLDQFEEFLVTCDPKLRLQLWAGLNNLLDSDLPVIVMAVMRDDFYSRFAQEAPPQVLEWIKRGIFPVSASLEPEDLREIIEQPASRVGLSLEEGLVEVIISDVLESCREDGGKAGRSTVLPLLEFALTQLWERREQGFLTHQAYQSIGKVTGSLTAWADQVCHSLEKEGLGSITRRIFTDLVNLGDEAQRLPDSRRRRMLDDLCNDRAERDSVHKVVQRLADARLVTTSADKGQVTVEIIHDSLIREWARLQRWLKKDRSFLAWERELERDAREWRDTSLDDAAKRDEGCLRRGLRLSDAERWFKERRNDLNETEIAFIQASVGLRETEQQKDEKARAEKEHIRRLIIQGIAVFSIVALALAVFAFIQMQQANEKTRESLALYLASQSEQVTETTLSSMSQKILLAVESLKHKETWQGDLALRKGLASIAFSSRQLNLNGMVTSVAFSPDGRTVAAASSDKTARLWDVASGQELYRLPHDDIVNSIAFSLDGRTVVTASDDKTARLWDVASGRELCKLTHNGRVNSVAFSPDGKTVATASLGSARLWDALSNQELHRLPHNGSVNCVVFSPDGRTVATAGDDKTARLWDAASGRELCKLTHNGMVTSVAFSPDGRTVATASSDKTARLWDVASGQELFRLPQDHIVSSVVFSPDGKTMAAATLGSVVWLLNVTSGRRLHELIHDGIVNSVAFSPDGRMVATASSENTALLWDVASGQELYKLTHDEWVSSVAFSPDGKTVATASLGSARLWNALSGQELHKLPHNDAVHCMVFSPDGNTVATASDDKTARLWDVVSGRELCKLIHEGTVRCVAFSPDGRRVATAGDDETARLWDVLSGQELYKFPHDDSVLYVAFSHDGRTIATASADNTTRLWDVASGHELHKLHHDGIVWSVAFSPDGKMVATASDDKTARLWDVASGQELHRLPHDDSVSSIIFSPDGKMVATASDDKTARLWDVASGRELHKLHHDGWVNSVAFSPDGMTVTTASRDRAARLWDVASGQELHKLHHDGWVNSVAFSPDGRILATASYDKIARLWDVASGQELHRLPHDGTVNSVVFSPDGNTVATASDDNTARLWMVSSQELTIIACKRITGNLTVQEWRLYGLDESDCLTCPREGKFNRSLSARLKGMLIGAGECMPCIGSLD